MKYGNATAQRYKVSRKTLYKWLKRYDETSESLMEKSRRLHRSPNAHTEEELRQVKRLVKKYHETDMILVFQEMKERCGYTRSYGGFKRVTRKLLDRMESKKPKKKRKNKPYRRAEYPEQKV